MLHGKRSRIDRDEAEIHRRGTEPKFSSDQKGYCEWVVRPVTIDIQKSLSLWRTWELGPGVGGVRLIFILWDHSGKSAGRVSAQPSGRAHFCTLEPRYER